MLSATAICKGQKSQSSGRNASFIFNISMLYYYLKKKIKIIFSPIYILFCQFSSQLLHIFIFQFGFKNGIGFNEMVFSVIPQCIQLVVRSLAWTSSFLKAILRKFTLLRGVNLKNPILLEDLTEIFKFTPLNRVNFREMAFSKYSFK